MLSHSGRPTSSSETLDVKTPVQFSPSGARTVAMAANWVTLDLLEAVTPGNSAPRFSLFSLARLVYTPVSEAATPLGKACVALKTREQYCDRGRSVVPAMSDGT